MLELRTWLRRRLVLTNDTIAFAQTDDDTMIDYIPLDEVVAICIMETQDEDRDFVKTQSSDTKSSTRGSQDCCSLLIKTTPDGQNGGRDYYLRADSAETCKTIVCTLERAANTANFRAKAKSRFAKSQFAVRKIHVSGLFHSTSAFLIAAVSAAWNLSLLPTILQVLYPTFCCRCCWAKQNLGRPGYRAALFHLP